MAQIKVFYEPETELLTIFWQSPRPNQIATELGNDIILFKDGDTNEPIGIEVLSYRPGDDRISGISLELGQQNLIKT
ncbi:MAG: hypothetical protein P5702_12935 [Limnospira sp. PMC 1291.21]|uniref:DUF2283 domain-containing protein n=2 Tax=Limnospira TaxID=2596745 RepID=A0A9P1P1Q4_9CYAN|nr:MULTISPECIES: hypothetical protein [Limnospira]EKD07569.1 hypothetical protein SPLC1_S412360 [Arthrospira platensis C1]MDY7051113.1 hypothetical protein [Limnospira fusiformis LS22]QJB25867.1 hypothetical protein HFV01_08690 [Limnospira fusiformis SAG 85.79]RAQ43855.1 hypothetical protein B9S53_10420 [Arthrospira sp. O9.13F]MDT9178370.1 hypothetical protein [Limnospira sp. PMC 1238.20]